MSKHGTQFSTDRFIATSDSEEDLVERLLRTVFEPHHLLSTEPDEPYDNFADEKAIHQLLDYVGIDYVVDPFDAAPFGINHRTHDPNDSTLRLDFRSDTGTSKPSELDHLKSDGPSFSLTPKYATRLKLSSTTGFEWFRVINLQPVTNAIRDGYRPNDVWEDDESDVAAWFIDYDTLVKWGAIEDDITPSDVPFDPTPERPEIEGLEANEIDKIRADPVLQLSDFIEGGS